MNARRPDSRTAYRMEDVTLLVADGGTIVSIADRLGLTPDGLRRWLCDHGHEELCELLNARAHMHPRLAHRLTTVPEVIDLPADAMTSHEVVTYAGITYRQLDYWTRAGILRPITAPTPGSGRQRHYARTEADVALTIRRLLDIGLQIREGARLARELLAGQTPRIGMFTLVPIPGDEATQGGDSDRG